MTQLEQLKQAIGAVVPPPPEWTQQMQHALDASQSPDLPPADGSVDAESWNLAAAILKRSRELTQLLERWRRRTEGR